MSAIARGWRLAIVSRRSPPKRWGNYSLLGTPQYVDHPVQGYMPHASDSFASLAHATCSLGLSAFDCLSSSILPSYLLWVWGDLKMTTKAERKFERYPYADPDTHPIPEVRAAITELLEHHSEVKEMPHPSQLKLSPWVSYYPTSRTVFIDGESTKRSGMGVKDVIALLDELGDLHPPTKSTVISFNRDG